MRITAEFAEQLLQEAQNMISGIAVRRKSNS